MKEAITYGKPHFTPKKSFGWEESKRNVPYSTKFVLLSGNKSGPLLPIDQESPKLHPSKILLVFALFLNLHSTLLLFIALYNGKIWGKVKTSYLLNSNLKQ